MFIDIIFHAFVWRSPPDSPVNTDRGKRCSGSVVECGGSRGEVRCAWGPRGRLPGQAVACDASWRDDLSSWSGSFWQATAAFRFQFYFAVLLGVPPLPAVAGGLSLASFRSKFVVVEVLLPA